MADASDRMIRLAGPTLRGLAALGPLVAAYARRRPDDFVPAAVLGKAKRLLGDAQKVLSREAGAGLYRLSGAPAWSELAAVLDLALPALQEFATRHQPDPPELRRIRRKIAERMAELSQHKEPATDH
jgi:hypothetical protein